MATPYLTLRNAQPASLAATQIAVSTLTGSTLSVQQLSTTSGKAIMVRQTANPTRYIELGADAANTSYIDFHSQDNVEADYSTRIQSVAGSTIGGGALMLYGSSIGINTSAITSHFQLSTSMTADLGGALRTQFTDAGYTAAILASYGNIYQCTVSGPVSGAYTITATSTAVTNMAISPVISYTLPAGAQVRITFTGRVGGSVTSWGILLWCSSNQTLWTTTALPSTLTTYSTVVTIPLSGQLGFVTYGPGSGAAMTLSWDTFTVQRLDTVATGRVGVNTTNPYAPLHVYGNSTGKVAELIHNPNATVGSSASLQYGLWQVSGSDSNGTGANGPAADISAICQNSANGNTDLSFSTYTGSLAAPTTYTLTERMRITAGGNVGIGLTNPSYKLHVNGTAQVGAVQLVNNTVQINSTTASYNSYNSGYPPNNSTIVRNSIGAYYGTRDGVVSRGAAIDFEDVNTNTEYPTAIRGGQLKFYTTSVVNQGQDASLRMILNPDGNLVQQTGAGPIHYLSNTSYTGTAGARIGEIYFSNGGGDASIKVINEIGGVNNNSAIVFCTSFNFDNMNVERMRLNRNGDLNISGALSKGSGTFDIAHPLHPESSAKRLVHSFIEGPRCDLIYRGVATLVAGTATVNIDKECTHAPECAMDEGTFEALCANADCFLQNKSGFARVRGVISGATLQILCEDSTSTDTITWMVIAERKDPFIKQWDRTNPDGFLITQYEKEALAPAEASVPPPSE